MIRILAAAIAVALIPPAGIVQGDNAAGDAATGQIRQASKNLQTLLARVVQKKYFSDLADEVTFCGTLVYAKPRHMRWDFSQPDPSSLLIRPDGAWLFIPGIKQVQKIGGPGQRKIDLFLLGMENSLEELGKEYRLEWAGEEALPQGHCRLLKCSKPEDPFAQEIWIWFDVAKGIPLRVRWNNAQGDNVTTDFLDVKINEGVDESLFDLKIPEGYETVIQNLSEDT